MFRIVFVNIAVFLGIAVVLETCSWSVLSYKDKAQPFLFDPSMGLGNKLQFQDPALLLTNLDPLLGFGYDPEAISHLRTLGTEYVVYGTHHPKSFHLVVTGGSTAQGFNNSLSWPQRLTEKLNEAGYCIRTYSGAVPAYRSSQEVVKMLRDHYALNPQMHISYSGVNERNEQWPYLVSPHMNKVMGRLIKMRHSFLIPNTVRLLGDMTNITNAQVRGYNLGLEQSHDRAELWTYNQRRMHALAKEFDYTFIGVLQPILGVGEYAPSDKERQRIKDLSMSENWSDFYEKARSEVKEKPYLNDFVDIFKGKTDMFSDDCHVTIEGDQIIADRMFQLLTTKHAKELAVARIADCQAELDKLHADR